MLKKFVIAAAALATVVTLASVPAKADSHIGISFGFGDFGDPYDNQFGYFPPPPPEEPVFYEGDFGYHHHRRHHYDNAYYSGVSCSGGANILRNAGFHGVEADDCSAPVYSYQAWKHGEQFDIQVSSRGRIISIDPAY